MKNMVGNDYFILLIIRPNTIFAQQNNDINKKNKKNLAFNTHSLAYFFCFSNICNSSFGASFSLTAPLPVFPPPSS
ncbi:uncharacterised protein [Saccharolobus solfataricus]|uniref:Uncharacterized protein n=1 Tax=Saccharolobus solfataricus TaxID=2287 RepID=A0A157T3A3_SACSO|nr:uncharacterised protein [Saccharolobus solfataricus]